MRFPSSKCFLCYVDFKFDVADQEQGLLPTESREIHALLAKLQDVAGGDLDSEWNRSSVYEQRKAAEDEGENNASGWERPEDRGAEGNVEERHRCVLEDFTPCSKSHLWKLMMSFYDRKGVESWSQVRVVGAFPLLPFFHTTQSLI